MFKKLCGVSGFILVIFLFCANSFAAGETVTFTKPAGYYTSEFSLGLSTNLSNATIYYTTDGTDPTVSTNDVYTYKYQIAIKKGTDSTLVSYTPMTDQVASRLGSGYIPSTPPFRGTTIRAFAKNATTRTPVVTHTYFVDTDMLTKFGSLPTINLSFEFAGFADPVTGFYTNFMNKELRSPAYFELIETNGVRVAGQYIEACINGYGSRGFAEKSIRIYFKDDAMPGVTGNPKKLAYNIFLGDAVNSEGKVLTEYKRLILRNSGNDCGVSHLRDAFIQRLSKGLNISTQAYRPAMLFINGEYWGIYNIRERYDDKYVQYHFGVTDTNVALLEAPWPIGLPNCSPYEISEGTQADADDFQALFEYAINNDLSNSTAFNYVASRLDVDSIMDYFIVESFVTNQDWPGNNVKIWKNRNAADPSGMDTKWRFMLNDTDMGFGLNGLTATTDFIGQTYGSDAIATKIMTALLRNPTFKRKYAERYRYVLDNNFVPDKMVGLLNQMSGAIRSYIPMLGNRWPKDDANLARFDEHITRMRDFANNRGQSVWKQTLSYLQIPFSEVNTLRIVNNSSYASLSVNNEAKTGNNFTINFESGASISISAQAISGYKISGFTYLDYSGFETFYPGNSFSYKPLRGGTIIVVSQPVNNLALKKRISAGMGNVFVLNDKGTLYGWGRNSNGLLGFNSSGANVKSPKPLCANIIDIASTDFHSLALTSDGRVLSAGGSNSTITGRDGDTSSFIDINFTNAAQVFAGRNHSLIITKNGDLYGFGENEYKQIGSGGNTMIPVKIASNVKTASAGRSNTMYVTNDGKLYTLGDNRFSKAGLGNETTPFYETPQFVMDNVEKVFALYHNCFAITTNGDLYGWGRNIGGSVGELVDASVLTPTLIASNVKTVAGSHDNTLILKNDGKLYGRGANNNGVLGTTAGGAKFELITGGIKDVVAGMNFAVMITDDNKIMTLGTNAEGELGNESATGDSNVPVNVFNLDNVTPISPLIKDNNKMSMKVRNYSGDDISFVIVTSGFNSSNKLVYARSGSAIVAPLQTYTLDASSLGAPSSAKVFIWGNLKPIMTVQSVVKN